jgi:hypothetical protein
MAVRTALIVKLLRAHHIAIAQGTFYLLVTGLLTWFGIFLQDKAFTPPSPAPQIYAAVYVRDPAAHVGLTAQVYPDDPWTDSVTVTVSGAAPKKAGWLLVVECPAGAPSLKHGVRLNSESVPQTRSSVTQATVYSGIKNPKRNIGLLCFPDPGTSPGPLGTAAYSPSLANVSLPALQLDPGVIAAQTAPVLYAQQNRPGGAVSQLIQVFPGSLCPSPNPIPATASPGTASATSPSPQSSVSTSSSATASPSATASASTTPTAVPSSSSSHNPGCYVQAPAGTTFIPYVLPTSVTTTETLNDMDTRGYQISMFPVGTPAEENGQRPGQIAEESITWNGKSGLNPSLDATNQAAETAASHDTFVAGISFGVASGTAVAFFDVLWQGWRQRRETKKKEAAGAAQAAASGGSEDATE